MATNLSLTTELPATYGANLRLPSRFSFAFYAALFSAGAAGACTPHIGDQCLLSTDCSVQGTLVCDTSQPNGYCTMLNCVPDMCQDTATCVELEPEVPGCPYDDQIPARTVTSLCLQRCTADSDCRQSDGYICADPRKAPWNAVILDDDQAQHVCIVAPPATISGIHLDAGADAVAPVCLPAGPDVPDIEAGVELEAPDGGPLDAPASGG